MKLNPLAELQVLILLDREQSALERTLLHLPDEVTQRTVFWLGETLPSDPEFEALLKTVQVHSFLPEALHQPHDHLAQLYGSVLAEASYPLLLLHAGEQLSPESWSALAELLSAPPEASVSMVRLVFPELELMAPRLFWEPATLQGAVFPQPVAFENADFTQTALQIEATESEWAPSLQGADAEVLARLEATGESGQDLQFALGQQAFQARQDHRAQTLFSALAHAEADSELSFWQQAGRVMLLKTLWELQQRDEALKQLDAFRQLALEQLPGLWVLRGVMARYLGEKELASDCFQQALEGQNKADFRRYNLYLARPDITWKPALGLAELQFEDGLYAQAFLQYQQARQALPEHPYVLSGLLKSAFFIQRYEVVAEILDSGLELREISAETRQALTALCALQNGQAQASLESLLSPYREEPGRLTQDPFFLSVLLELSIALLRQQQSAEARQILGLLVQLIPDQPLIRHNLAYSHFAEGHYAEAEVIYREVLQHSPRFVESRFDLAKTLVMQGRIEEARAELEAILAQNPRFYKAHQALKQLEQRELEAHLPIVTPSPSSEDKTQDRESLPFVFVFPLEATWENGVDIALKAYYQEFLPEDNVVLALPAAEATEAVAAAQAWAAERFDPELLPPVALLEAPLPLLAGQSAWILPWRLHPGEAVLTQLAASGYPVVQTALALEGHPESRLPAALMRDEEADKTWLESDPAALSQVMRLLCEGLLPEAVTEALQNLDTHALSGLRSEARSLSAETPDVDSDGRSLSISLCMIVRDEAQNLGRCLDSVHDGVDEIIVVDTGSQDLTPEIAAAYAKVSSFSYPWQDDFAAARNFALEQAHSDWVLVLDGDEFVPPGFLEKLRFYLQGSDQPDAYAFPILALDENDQEVPELSLGAVPRLFRNDPAYRYRGLIHEMVYHRDRPQMRYFLLKSLPIYHLGYQEAVRAEKQKYQRDTRLMHEMLERHGDHPETARIHNILASVYEEQEEWEAALAQYEQGLASVQEDPLIRQVLTRGKYRLLLRLGREQQLIDELGGRPELRDPHLSLYLAEAYFRTGQAANALAHADLALEERDRQSLHPDPLGQQPTREELYQLLAQLSTRLNRKLQALYYLKHCLKLNPEDTQLRRQYQALQDEVETFSAQER